MAFNRILDFSNGLDFYLGFFFSPTYHGSVYVYLDIKTVFPPCAPECFHSCYA
jgi:hypothetical protein